jgi:hypothetical protein
LNPSAKTCVVEKLLAKSGGLIDEAESATVVAALIFYVLYSEGIDLGV